MLLRLKDVFMSKSLTLAAHGFTAEIWPHHGANVVRLIHEGDGVGTPLLYTPINPQPGDSPSWFGLWSMVPLCNRAFGAKLDTGFEIFDLPANDPAELNIHGFGWQAAWDVIQRSSTRVVMEHRASGKGPYAYLARLSVSLDETGVNFDLALRHQGPEPLPYGMGFHPWFPANDKTRVTLKAAGEIYMREGFHPVAHGPVRPEHDFSKGRKIREGHGETDRERAVNFIGWDGVARIDWPDRAKSLSILASPNLNSPVLWSPKGADFVCFEPQSHAVGAQTEGLIRAIAPLKTLAPGETLHGAMRLSISDLT
jgi:aldose 1-epimerase